MDFSALLDGWGVGGFTSEESALTPSRCLFSLHVTVDLVVHCYSDGCSRLSPGLEQIVMSFLCSNPYTYPKP